MKSPLRTLALGGRHVPLDGNSEVLTPSHGIDMRSELVGRATHSEGHLSDIL
jgi:hypothetical protein